MNRRQLLRGSATAAAALGVNAASYRRVLGANETVRVGLVGCGSRGLSVARTMAALPGVSFVAVADVFEPHADAARAWAGADARAYKDFRQVLERKDVDAVLVATPDHWHAIPTVLACQADKDVFVEKPLAHNIKEGRAMVNAARRFKRVVQTGTQHRAAPHYREVQEIVQSGKLGEVRFVRVWNYANWFPTGIGREPDGPAPPGLDWDFYLGPAPKVPFNPARFLRTFRLFWDYAGGWMTDFGTHRLDTVQQIMGVEAPLTVSAVGQRFSLRDAGEMPDILQVSYQYAGFVMSYETCNLNAHGVGGRTPGVKYYNARSAFDRPHGEAFYGTNGTLFSDRIGYEIFPEAEPTPPFKRAEPPKSFRMERKVVAATDRTDLLCKDFVDCVRSRKTPVADVEIGHRSTTVAHLGNIAYRTGRKLVWDARAEEIKERVPEATRLLGRPARAPWNLV